MKNIPIHQLQKKWGMGLVINYFKRGDLPEQQEESGIHRDDHYIFFLFENGKATLLIDFQELSFCEGSIYYILPGQVHHRIHNELSDGWFIGVDRLLIFPEYRAVLEGNLALQQPILLDDYSLIQCKAILRILKDRIAEDNKTAFHIPVAHTLIQSFIGIIAGSFTLQNSLSYTISRPIQLVHQFRKLLSDNFVSMKNPVAYAAKLNVTENYLNEVLKKVTGFPVSYWIIQEVMLEAKRLLYYSALNVKEITHTLGYTDPAYFSRLFKKSEGMSPLSFRSKYFE